ncbi:MAG TPA: hypothetical protein VGA61_11220, partial [Anaerolineae bacterium]
VLLSVIVYKGKAFVPTSYEVDKGLYRTDEPIRVVKLDLEALQSALEDAFQLGNPPYNRQLHERARSHKDVVLQATHATSWLALARHGYSYGIAWRTIEAVLAVSRVDEKGRFVDDPSKTQHFAPDTSMKVIAEAILADMSARPEVQ